MEDRRMNLQPAMMLLISLVFLAAGPLLYQLVRRSLQVGSVMDAFVLTSIGGLVLLHILPDTYGAIGLWAVPLLLMGLLLPFALEHSQRRAMQNAHRWVVIVAIAGLILHAMFDGMVLSASEGDQALGWAIALHRIPEGLAIWWLVAPAFGFLYALAAVAISSVATIGGYLVGAEYTHIHETMGWAIMQTVVAGALLHVVVHREGGADDGVSKTGLRWTELVAGLAGLAMVLAISRIEGDDWERLAGYGSAFLHLLLESAPALLVGYVLAGLIATFMPRASIGWISRGSSFSQAGRGMAFGIPLPICSCGVVPLYHSLIKKGVPAPAAMAFLVATPELGIESILLSIPLLGLELTGARLVAAAAVALAIGWIIGRRCTVKDGVLSPEEAEDDSHHKGSVKERTQLAMHYGFVRLVDDTAPWILLGLAIAAAVHPSVFEAVLTSLPAGFDVIFFALIGIPIYVCASGGTPLAAALIFAGASPGAAIAFLLSGPATNVTTFGILSKLHGRRTAVTFGVGMFLSAVSAGYIINLLFAGVTVPDTVAMTHEHHSLLSWLCLAVLAALFLASLLRIGPRGFASTVMPFGGDHHHDHGHDHGHHHHHGHDCGHDHHHHGHNCGHDHHRH
jgi:uncharacterized protein